MQHIRNTLIYWSLFKGNGRSFDVEQLNDPERLKSAATHNPLGSKNPLVLADLREFQIKSFKNGI